MTQENVPSWVSIMRIQAPGLVWRCVSVRHLPGTENSGNHHVFVTCIENGQIVRDGKLQVAWGWEGQKPGELSSNKLCDKQAPTPYSTDIPINAGMHTFCSVVDQNGYPSDEVRNLHTALPSDGPGNDFSHHSYSVVFELKQNDMVASPNTDNIRTVIEEARTLLSVVIQATQDLSTTIEKLDGLTK